jgi:hypothetical protein
MYGGECSHVYNFDCNARVKKHSVVVGKKMHTFTEKFILSQQIYHLFTDIS